LVIFTLLSLQNILGYFFQIRQYQKMVRKWIGKGILGIGQRRGLFVPGEICILVYNQKDNTVITVQSMRGFSIFVKFKEKEEYAGLSLEDLHRLGLEADRKDMGLWRKLFRYQANENSKRKGALIQAVEAIEKDLAKKRLNPVPAPTPTTTHSAYFSPAPVTPAPAAETVAADLVQDVKLLPPAPDISNQPTSLSWGNDNAGKS
jgi:glucitol operon activator protein